MTNIQQPKAPMLLATAHNQAWSWGIAKLKGPAKWTCLHSYVILDIFSRHVVGWLIAERERADLAGSMGCQKGSPGSLRCR